MSPKPRGAVPRVAQLQLQHDEDRSSPLLMTAVEDVTVVSTLTGIIYTYTHCKYI